MKSSDFDTLFRRDPTAPGSAFPPEWLTERLLESVDVRAEAFAICRISREAALVIPAISDLTIMYVLQGTLHLCVDGNEPLVLSPGSIVLQPKNRASTLTGCGPVCQMYNASEVIHMGIDNLMSLDAFAGDAHEIRVACSRIEVGFTGDYSAFDGLVRPISAKPSNDVFIRSAFETMLDESRFMTAGFQALVNTLMKACIVELLRHDLGELHDPRGSASLIPNPDVGRSVIAILMQPSAMHSVASLAKTARMSRSAFAKAFTETTGATPIEFLTRTRLTKARGLIAGTSVTIASIAMSVGFASRSHFSLKFRQYYGEDPTAYRKRTRREANVATSDALTRLVPANTLGARVPST